MFEVNGAVVKVSVGNDKQNGAKSNRGETDKPKQLFAVLFRWVASQ